MFLTGDHQLHVKGTDDDVDGNGDGEDVVVIDVVVIIIVELDVLDVDDGKAGPGKSSLLGGSNSRNGSFVLFNVVDVDGRAVVVVSLAFLAIH